MCRVKNSVWSPSSPCLSPLDLFAPLLFSLPLQLSLLLQLFFLFLLSPPLLLQALTLLKHKRTKMSGNNDRIIGQFINSSSLM